MKYPHSSYKGSYPLIYSTRLTTNKSILVEIHTLVRFPQTPPQVPLPSKDLTFVLLSLQAPPDYEFLRLKNQVFCFVLFLPPAGVRPMFSLGWKGPGLSGGSPHRPRVIFTTSSNCRPTQPITVALSWTTTERYILQGSLCAALHCLLQPCVLRKEATVPHHAGGGQPCSSVFLLPLRTRSQRSLHPAGTGALLPVYLPVSDLCSCILCTITHFYFCCWTWSSSGHWHLLQLLPGCGAAVSELFLTMSIS